MLGAHDRGILILSGAQQRRNHPNVPVAGKFLLMEGISTMNWIFHGHLGLGNRTRLQERQPSLGIRMEISFINFKNSYNHTN